MSFAATFNLRPSVSIQGHHTSCWTGWEAIGEQLRIACERVPATRVVMAIECYPSVDETAICDALERLLKPTAILRTETAFKPPEEVERIVAHSLTDDPVFGRVTSLSLNDFLDPHREIAFRMRIEAIDRGLVVVCGAAATLLCEPDVLIYADLPRWEAQGRFRRNAAANLGADNRTAPWQEQYKRGFFVDWRVADTHKRKLYDDWDYVLDSTRSHTPKMAAGQAIRDALRQTAQRPFSLVPYFDPAPWGGHWMQKTLPLDPEMPNYGWCFNCVPEENSLLLDFGTCILELPAIDLVFFQPLELLGPEVYACYGAEFSTLR